MVTITPFYAAILGFLFFVLSFRTLRLRRRLQIAIGDGGNQPLLRAMRVHANFAEYVPLSLVMVLMLELAAAYDGLVHLLCICLVLGRLIHAYGVSQVSEDYRFRVVGMALTLVTLVGSAVSLLVVYALHLLV